MTYIDELKRQINRAQAEAMRKNDSISSKTDQIHADTLEILGNIRAEEAKKQAAQVAAVQQTTQPTDTRTTAQKAADAQSAYDAYMGSEEQKINQQEANRQAVWAAMDRIFAAGPGVSASDMPLNIVSVNPVDTKQEELKATADYYKTQKQAEENQKVLDAKLAEYETWSAEDKAALDQYMTERDMAQNNLFGAPQFDTYNLNPLVQKMGIGEVREMAEAVQRNRNAKTMEETTAAANKLAEKKPVLGSVASVGANLIGSYAGTVEAAKEAANRTGQFGTLDTNNLGGIGSQFGSAIRQNVSQQIEGENGNWLRKVAAIGYEGVMSAADSTTRLAAGGFNPGVSAAIAASGSFNNSLRQYSAQGATPEQAAAAAIVTSGIEYLTEKIPMDELLKVGKGGWKDLLKQAFLTEPTTEEISLFANTAAETLILGKNSDRSQKIGELVANGATYKEAQEQINKELWKEAAKTYAVSAVSGGVSAGGAQIAEQRAIEKLGAELAKNVVDQARPQPTEQELQLKQATDALFGVKPTEEQKNTAQEGGENKTTGSIATPESAKPTLFTSETTGGTAPVETVPSLSGDAEASRFTSNNATKSDAVSNDSITESGTQVKGTGAAEQNFSGKAQYQDLLYEGNVQPDRLGDVRPMEVPKTDSYGRNVSDFVGNAYGAEVTPDTMASQIENLVQEGALGFDRRSNQDALNDAAKEIEKKGAYSVRNQITMNAANGKIKDGDIEKAMLLYANYANKKGQQAMDNASELMVDLATMAHMTGRNLQLFKLLRKMTPEGQAMTIRKTVERNVESMIRSGQVKKGYSTEIDPALLKEYQEAAAENARAVSDEQKEISAERMQQIQQAIFAAEAAKMPATFKAKWDAWRYMAMLGNAKTQVRNVVGNALFAPYKQAKDTMAAIFETALPTEKRTKVVFQDAPLLEWAKADAKSEDVRNALKYSAKLGDDVSTAKFAENRKVFDAKALEAVRKFVEKMPQAGDMVFKNGYYAKSLAGFLKARGYDIDDVQNGNVSDAVMAEARGYAIQEAMKATFNDSNAFSDAFSGIGRKQTDNPWSKALNVAAEGILPFRRTPANIVVRFAEYSPVGLAKGVWDMATKVRSGDLSAAAAIDQISAGLTGSAAMALGYFLAKGMMGVKLTGSGTDDDEKRQGHQDYALEFSIDGQEYSYKIDWAAPANLPLFMGANLYQAMEDAGGDTDVSKFTSILHSLGTMFEPMLALSCMSSLNDLVEGIRYAPEGEALYSIAADVATSYFTQGVPALVRQTHQAIRENKQTTFANSEDATIRDLQKLGAQITGGGASQTDKLNAWGETETTESGWERAFNAYFNPGTYKRISNDPVEKELNRLKAEGKDITPPTAAKNVSYTDKTGEKHENQRLTEEQYQTLAKTQGQTAKKLLDQIINSQDYKSLTEMQQEAAVKAVYEYAAEAGKKAALPDYYSQADAWISRVDADPVNGIIQRGAEKVLESVVSNAVKSLAKGWAVTDAAKKDMDESYAAFENMTEEAKTALLNQITGDALKYLEVRSGGVSTEQYLQAAEDVKQLKPEEGYSDIRDVQTREAIADSGLDAEVIDTIMKAYMKDYDPEDDAPDKTELRYEYARKELGLSPAEYAEVYRVQADGGEKDEKIKAWVALGYSQQEAMILYNLFASTSKQAIDVVKWHNEQ